MQFKFYLSCSYVVYISLDILFKFFKFLESSFKVAASSATADKLIYLFWCNRKFK